MKNIKINNKMLRLIYLVILIGISVFAISVNFTKPSDFIFNSDGFFHFQRFQFLCEQFHDGIFSPFINYNALNGYGYATSLFYPDILYYPFALLTFFNISVLMSFKIYLISVFMGNVLITYFVLSKIENKIIKKPTMFSLIFTSLYVFNSINYYHTTYGRFSELTALMFMPLVFYGFYYILKENSGYKYLVIGMTGLVYSHMLSFVMVFVTLLLLSIANIKWLIKEPRKILNIVYCALLTFMLSIKQLIPLFMEMKTNTFKYSDSFFKVDWSDKMGTSLPIYVSILFIILCIVFFIISHKLSIENNYIILGILLYLTQTALFPWGFVQKNFPGFIDFIQFPRRLLVTSLILLIIGISIQFYKVFVKDKKIFIVVELIVVLATFLMYGIYIYGERPFSEKYSYTYNIQAFDDGQYLGGYDYLPINFDINNITAENEFFNKDIGKYLKDKKDTFTDCEIKQDKNVYTIKSKVENQYVKVPVTYYKNYVAKTSHEDLKIRQSDDGLVEIFVEDKSKEIELYYQNSFVQLLCWFISFLTAISLPILYWKEKRKDKK